jgi:hypothetical protein
MCPILIDSRWMTGTSIWKMVSWFLQRITISKEVTAVTAAADIVLIE